MKYGKRQRQTAIHHNGEEEIKGQKGKHIRFLLGSSEMVAEDRIAGF
jgi:hypothetical protein